MPRFFAGFALATFVLGAVPAVAQGVLTGPSSVGDTGNRAGAQPAVAAIAIDYDVAHLEKRLSAIRANMDITLDGALDESAWSEAPVANGFIQNDPREGTAATYDTEVRVLYTDDALYFG